LCSDGLAMVMYKDVQEIDQVTSLISKDPFLRKQRQLCSKIPFQW
jgi:hypothetical protein